MSRWIFMARPAASFGCPRFAATLHRLNLIFFLLKIFIDICISHYAWVLPSCFRLFAFIDHSFEIPFSSFLSFCVLHSRPMEWHYWWFGQRFSRHVIRTVERIEVSSNTFPIKMFTWINSLSLSSFILTEPVPKWSILVFHIFKVASRCWRRPNANPKYRCWLSCCHFHRNCGLPYSHRWI